MTITEALKVITGHPDFEEFKVDRVYPTEEAESDPDKIYFRAHIYEDDDFSFLARTAEEAIIKLAEKINED